MEWLLLPLGGSVETNHTVNLKFNLSELHDNRTITWNVHLAQDLGAYDMIIGRDLLSDLSIDLRFSDQTIVWDGHDIPFKESDATPETSFHIRESMAVDDATKRVKEILDAKYLPANLEETETETSSSPKEVYDP